MSMELLGIVGATNLMQIPSNPVPSAVWLLVM